MLPRRAKIKWDIYIIYVHIILSCMYVCHKLLLRPLIFRSQGVIKLQTITFLRESLRISGQTQQSHFLSLSTWSQYLKMTTLDDRPTSLWTKHLQNGVKCLLLRESHFMSRSILGKYLKTTKFNLRPTSCLSKRSQIV